VAGSWTSPAGRWLISPSRSGLGALAYLRPDAVKLTGGPLRTAADGSFGTISTYSADYLTTWLAWYERDVAEALFAPTRDRIEHAEDRDVATWGMPFRAWSLFDPRAGSARLERVPVRDDLDPSPNAARIAVAASLGRSHDLRWRGNWPQEEILLGGTKRGC
jgi:hypothetical protein